MGMEEDGSSAIFQQVLVEAGSELLSPCPAPATVSPLQSHPTFGCVPFLFPQPGSHPSEQLDLDRMS